MKNLTSVVVVGLSFVTAHAIAGSLDETYKCYIYTSRGEQIAYFSWLKEEADLRAASLISTEVGILDNQSVYVRNVIECIPDNRDFKSLIARGLDRKHLK